MDFINAIVLLLNYIFVPALTYGSQLALGAIFVTLIYGVLRFANFATGDMMSFGTMFAVLFTWYFQSLGVSLGFLPTALLAIPFFDVSVFDMGLPLLGFFFNLVLTGWAISQLVTGILIRYGLGAESLTWVLPFLIAPFSCIYYPLSTLPEWMQSIAVFIPTTYVFEGMRNLLIEGVFEESLMVKGFILNLFYLVIGLFVFFISFQAARKHGLLLQSGE